MNQLILTSAMRAILMVGGGILTGKGLATSGEVSDLTNQLTTVGAGLVSLATAAYAIYTRTTAKQVQMTNSLPKVVSPAVAAKK